ncbi:unnamed protein product [Lampetra fluviatilis]
MASRSCSSSSSSPRSATRDSFGTARLIWAERFRGKWRDAPRCPAANRMGPISVAEDGVSSEVAIVNP